jgi:uncharacterized protein (TIGR02217 family)
VNVTTGLIALTAAPPACVDITAGLEFDVPVRFDHRDLEAALLAADLDHRAQGLRS